MVTRLIFLGFNTDFIPTGTESGFLAKSVYIGLFYDIKWVAILIVIPLVLLIIKSTSTTQWLLRYTLTWSIIWSLFASINTFYYQEWGTFINLESFSIIYHEGLNSSLFFFLFKTILLAVFVFGIIYFIFKKYIFKQVKTDKTSTTNYSLLWVLSLFIIILTFGNKYFQNYSSVPFFNHLAQGPSLVYLGKSNIDDSKWLDNKYIDMNVAVGNYYKLYTKNSHPSKLDLSLEIPNILLVFSPQSKHLPLDTFIVFDNLTSRYHKLEQHLPAIINGASSLPHINLMNYPEKMNNMPSLVKSLRDHHYQTKIYVSETLNGQGINNYMKYQNFHTVLDDYNQINYDSKTPHFTCLILDKKEKNIWENNIKIDSNTLVVQIPFQQKINDIVIYKKQVDTLYRYDNYYNEEDFTVTLLNALKIPTGGYLFSKDIIADSIPHFSFSIEENIISYLDDTSSYEYKINDVIKKVPESKNNTSDYLFSIMQMIQEDFRSK